MKAKVNVEFGLEKIWKLQCFDYKLLEIWEWIKITRGLYSSNIVETKDFKVTWPVAVVLLWKKGKKDVLFWIISIW